MEWERKQSRQSLLNPLEILKTFFILCNLTMVALFVIIFCVVLGCNHLSLMVASAPRVPPMSHWPTLVLT